MIAPYRSVNVGDFKVTTLLAAHRPMEDPHGTFGLNASDEDFAAAAEANFIPADSSVNFFTPVLVETGSDKILFDTGLSPEGVTAALKAAGHAPEDISTVVLTHMHPDHIGGLMGDSATFTNAQYVTGKTEFDYWAGAENETFETKMRPLESKTTFVSEGDSVASGITAHDAFGHTPGHMVFRLESAGQALLLAADTTNHYVFSLQHPDWEVRFDMDKAKAAETRRRILDMVAVDRIPMIGYHMPFPGIGYVEQNGSGYRFVPVSYQLM